MKVLSESQYCVSMKLSEARAAAAAQAEGRNPGVDPRLAGILRLFSPCVKPLPRTQGGAR